MAKTTRTIANYRGYADYILDHLDLTQWDVVVVHDNAKAGGNDAQVFVRVDATHAVIFLSDKFFSRKYHDIQITRALIHEVMHIHFAEIDHHVRQLPRWIEVERAAEFRDDYNHLEERAVYRLERVVCKAVLPFAKWVKKYGSR